MLRMVPLPRKAREEEPPSGSKCRAIRRVNRVLQPWVRRRRERLLTHRSEIARALQAENVLTWREYGYCLYPQRTLREFLSDILRRKL